jgi:hypothetical protein
MNAETIKEAARLLGEIDDFENALIEKLEFRDTLVLDDSDVKLMSTATRDTVWLTELTKEDKASLVRSILALFEGRVAEEIDKRKKRLRELGVEP